MKYLILLFVFIPIFFSFQNAQAIVVRIDSVYADSCYQDGIYGVTSQDSARMLHKFDNQLGQLTGNGPIIDLAFKKFKSKSILQMKLGDTVLIWGKKDKTVDSSAGKITFNIYDDALGMLVSSSGTILSDGVQVVPVPPVPGNPNGHWDYVELTLSGDLVKHATSYFIDAVALLKDTTISSVPTQQSPISLISSYPNPFIGITTIHFDLEGAGEIELSIIDALGREIDKITPGYLESGVHEIPIALRTPGFYFVRLFKNGQLVGTPLKITSR